MPLDAIARACELPRSTAYHLVSAMVDEGFVVHLADEHRYGLGVAAFEVGSGYARQAPLQRIARRPLAELVDRTGQSAHLAVLHGSDVLYVLEERAPGRPPLVTDVGVRLPGAPDRERPGGARAPAGGAGAGALPLAGAFVERHGAGPTSLSALRSLLTETRQRGYAVEDRRGDARAVQRRRRGARPQRPSAGRRRGDLRRGRRRARDARDRRTPDGRAAQHPAGRPWLTFNVVRMTVTFTPDGKVVSLHRGR